MRLMPGARSRRPWLWSGTFFSAVSRRAPFFSIRGALCLSFPRPMRRGYDASPISRKRRRFLKGQKNLAPSGRGPRRVKPWAEGPDPEGRLLPKTSVIPAGLGPQSPGRLGQGSVGRARGRQSPGWQGHSAEPAVFDARSQVGRPGFGEPAPSQKFPGSLGLGSGPGAPGSGAQKSCLPQPGADGGQLFLIPYLAAPFSGKFSRLPASATSATGKPLCQ